MFKSLKNNDSGVMMVTVLIVSLVLIIMAISVLSLNVSQVTLGEEHVESVKAQQLAIGAWSVAYSNMVMGGDPTPRDFSETLDDRAYNASVNLTGTANGPNQTDTYQIDVTY